MGLFSKCVNAVRWADEVLFDTGPAIPAPELVRGLLAETNVVIADVGAAGGLDPRWRAISPFVHTLTFEPRPGEIRADARTTNFPVALGAAREERTLHLARFAQAASLYRLNRELFDEFAAGDVLEDAGESRVQVDTLDNCIANGGGFEPDFIKIDVEGAELEVLQGAIESLKRRVSGLRIEVSLLPRHVGAPLFHDLQRFLEERGFALFILGRVRMIRRNRIHSALSQPQFVWGDAVFFLSRRSFLERLRGLPADERPAALVKFVVVLLAHRAHDYAYEVAGASLEENLASPELTNELKSAIRKSARGVFAFFCAALGGFLFALAVYAVSWPARGTRRMAGFLLRRRAGLLFHFLSNWSDAETEATWSVIDPLP